MFVFNTTFVIKRTKFSDWKIWLNDTYKPLFKNLITDCEIGAYEVMSVENKEEISISVQLKVATPNDIEVINKQSAIVLGQMGSIFGQEALYFSSILKSL